MNNSQIKNSPNALANKRNNGNGSTVANGNVSVSNNAVSTNNAAKSKVAAVGNWWNNLGGLTKVFILVGFILLIGIAIYAGIKAAKNKNV